MHMVVPFAELFNMIRNPKLLSVLALLLLGIVTALVRARDVGEYPRPSPYPVSWELKFAHATPKRIVVTPASGGVPQPYWYMTYAVTNNSDKEQTFLPVFELVTRTGKAIRSDNSIPAAAFDAIKLREKNHFLEPSYKIAGQLRVGDDQAKEGIAIWPEPDPRMGSFSIYVAGLSGEIAELRDDGGAVMKDKDGQAIILHKTLQLNYLIRGDEVYPGEDEVNEKSETSVMR